MAKACTDLEQSQTLAKILPLDSADMVYIATGYDDNGELLYTAADYKSEYIWEDNEVIHCWSLAALLERIPSDLGSAPLTIGKDDSERLKYWLNYHDRWEREDDIQTKYYDNLVDACYEMIVKLHKQKFI